MSKTGWLLLIGLLLAIVLATLASPFASPWPDGLEKVAAKLGFIQKAEGKSPLLPAPIPDYAMPGVHRQGLATALAGLIGTLLVFGSGYLLARWAASGKDKSKPEAPS
jgi:cobalt/nickel transport protein